MKIYLLFLFVILFSIFGCSKPESKSNSNSPNATVSNITPEVKKTEETKTEEEKTETADNSVCYNLKREDLTLDKKQTFAIDFKPFEKSCFVTFHNPEFDNPPLGSQFFIYKNGKEIFNFPKQFGGGNTTCWVDAVDFADVNDDQLKDIIVVGKCGAKADAYNENMVYINTGRDFVTNAKSNAETMDFSQTGQIKDFVKKNPKMFSK